ncbi:MAG: hypothetical protein RI637_04045 [Acidimicrobiia bacterium]|nr:hypothetical protein [Acidimicrobiia bacterium]
MRDETFLLLGGAGLVGTQVARRIISDLEPRRVVIGDLVEEGSIRAVEDLRSLFPHTATEIIGEWGDVFLRESFSRRPRDELLEDPDAREGIFSDLLGPIDAAYQQSSLARLILQHRPNVIVDCINTATAISYQDVYTTSIIAKQTISEVPPDHDPVQLRNKTIHDVEALILSQAVPQLIRHVLILSRAMHEAGTRLYLKVGTTGTGGMGLNIPYTHSEDRPSAKLMTKTSVAFAHTGLLFLLARTHGEPVVKEVKPAALIGFSAVEYRTVLERGKPLCLYAAQTIPVDSQIELRVATSNFERLADLQLPVVDTGENGVFTKGEFEAITSIGQMEYVTPEEVAHTCMQEIMGGNTGRDVIGAIDGSLLGSSYRAGILRSSAMDNLERLEAETGTHSVALGQLGPPELSKLLWEAELLRLAYQSLPRVLASAPSEISSALTRILEERVDLRDTITSLGLPILTADARNLIRGPFVRIPEVPGARSVTMGGEDRDAWARKGWIDLRPENFAVWQQRITAMREARGGQALRGSAAASQEAYLQEDIHIGTVAAWILTNEHDGFRIK